MSKRYRATPRAGLMLADGLSTAKQWCPSALPLRSCQDINHSKESPFLPPGTEKTLWSFSSFGVLSKCANLWVPFLPVMQNIQKIARGSTEFAKSCKRATNKNRDKEEATIACNPKRKFKQKAWAWLESKYDEGENL